MLTEDFAAGRTDNIHQVMIAAEKSDIALQFTMQIRNKILDAYNEIMRMQI
jgi:flagellar hook-basal body complex protein FliE